MCGRYCITSAPAAIRALFRYKELPNFPPRYNVAPAQPVPIVRLEQGERRFALVRWGLLPAWVKDPRGFSVLINGRAETLNDKPAFRSAMKRRRCLFPADGFYEWKVEGGRKRPYVARPADGGPVAFAGLWENWTGPNGEEMETAAIVTTEANAEMGRIHHRAPVILQPDNFELWLDSSQANEREAAALLRPAPDGLMRVHEVSPAVNKVGNDSPELLLPYTAPDEPDLRVNAPRGKSKRVTSATAEDDSQGSLF